MSKPKTPYRALKRLPESIEQRDLNAKFKFTRGGAKRLSAHPRTEANGA